MAICLTSANRVYLIFDPTSYIVYHHTLMCVVCFKLLGNIILVGGCVVYIQIIFCKTIHKFGMIYMCI